MFNLAGHMSHLTRFTWSCTLIVLRCHDACSLEPSDVIIMRHGPLNRITHSESFGVHSDCQHMLK